MEGSIFRPLSAAEVYCNGRIKTTQDGEILEAVWASRPVFKAVAAETDTKQERALPSKTADGCKRAANRAKKELFELALCNKFDVFVTMTCDRQKVDRYDKKQVTQKLNRWLDNMVRRHGLRYLVVPELHKDGALHFHGLMNQEALRLVDSGHRDKSGRTVYNCENWGYGFTTAVKLDGEYGAVCRYVSKYITKQVDDGGKVLGRYFYRSSGLQKPLVEYVWWDERPEGKEVKIEDAGLTLVYR